MIIYKINNESYDFSNIENLNLCIANCGNDYNAILTAKNNKVKISYNRYKENQTILNYENKYFQINNF